MVGNPLPAAAAHEVCAGCAGPGAGGWEMAGGWEGAIATGAMGLATGAGTCAGTTCEGTTPCEETLLDPSSVKEILRNHEKLTHTSITQYEGGTKYAYSA